MADFQRRLADFSARGIAVIAASSDPLDDAERTVAAHGLTFPLGYGLDAADVAATTGAFYDRDGGYLEATGFIVRPDRRVAIAVYSTGGVGRLGGLETLNVVRYLEKKRETTDDDGRGPRGYEVVE